jgi:hypothetical protein
VGSIDVKAFSIFSISPALRETSPTPRNNMNAGTFIIPSIKQTGKCASMISELLETSCAIFSTRSFGSGFKGAPDFTTVPAGIVNFIATLEKRYK